MKNKGITLVALIITIIILLILAGITIGQLTGSGLFENAKLAKEKYENAQEKEQLMINEYEEYINSGRETITIDKAQLETLVNKAVEDKLKELPQTASVDGNPIGTVIAYMIDEVPSGYLACNGQEVSRTTYSGLFAKIGTKYGDGDGSTTFNVPDLQGEFLRGTGENSHEDQGSGLNVGVHRDGTAIPIFGNHTNTLFIAGNNSNTAIWNADNVVSSGGQRSKVALTGQTGPYNADAGSYSGIAYVSPTNTSVLYCIKY